MGQELQRRAPVTPARQKEPSWPTVASTTVRLWLDRHRRPPAVRRRRLVLVLSALLALALGAGVTLAFTGRGPGNTASRPTGPAQSPNAQSPNAQSPNALQAAAAARHQAAAWIGQQVASSVLVGCDPEMCNELQSSGFPAGQLDELQPSAPDPLGSVLVVATPVIRNQFGTRLASVYAPLVIASFGSGADRVDVRYVAPDGTAAFQSRLAADWKDRVGAGEQLLANKRIQASAVARRALLAGQVDPRLLVTLSTLAHQMPLRLVSFDDPSPGVNSDVPLRGAELGTVATAGLSAMVTFLNAQQSQYKPAVASITTVANGQSVVTVRYDAPGPMGLGGS
jgi:hypothetical protein